LHMGGDHASHDLHLDSLAANQGGLNLQTTD